jgi:anti-sigma regulatory factor (Ser/Thr protein kinase)
LTAEIGAIAGLDRWFTAVGAQFGLPEDVVEELRVCLHEAVGNVILHGGIPGQQHRIWVTATARPSEVGLSVEDDAKPFNPLIAPSGPVTASLEDAPIGGLGLHLIRCFTDRLDYDRPDGQDGCYSAATHCPGSA